MDQEKGQRTEDEPTDREQPTRPEPRSPIDFSRQSRQNCPIIIIFFINLLFLKSHPKFIVLFSSYSPSSVNSSSPGDESKSSASSSASPSGEKSGGNRMPHPITSPFLHLGPKAVPAPLPGNGSKEYRRISVFTATCRRSKSHSVCHSLSLKSFVVICSHL